MRWFGAVPIYMSGIQHWYSHRVWCSQGQIRLSHQWQPAENAVSGYDGHYEKVDWVAAVLELDPRPDGHLFCRAYAWVTLLASDVKGKKTVSPALTSMPTGVMLLKRWQPDEPAAALNKFCSIHALNGVYTEFGIAPQKIYTMWLNNYHLHFTLLLFEVLETQLFWGALYMWLEFQLLNPIALLLHRVKQKNYLQQTML